MNTKLILGMLLLVFGSMSFALVDAFWVSPTPANDSEYWGDSFEIVMNASSPMDGAVNYIEINGVNKTCDLVVGNLSCNYTVPYSEKIYNNTYTIIGYANVSGAYRQTNETRVIYYVGCGLIGGDETLLQDVGSSSWNDSDCFWVIANNTEIDCDGHSITLEDDSIYNAISATNMNELIIENCDFESGSEGVYLDTVNSSTIRNNLFNNQTYDSMEIDDSNWNNITYNNFIMDGLMYDTWAIDASDCNYNNISYNNASGGEVGFDIYGGHNYIYGNRIHDAYDDCIQIDGNGVAGTNYLIDNEIYNCDIGLILEDAYATTIAFNHFYNNSEDYTVWNMMNNGTNMSYGMVYSYFDRVAGDYTNYSSVSILDGMLSNSAYTINWALVNQTPSGRISFLGKFIEVDAAPVNSGYNQTEIDYMIFTWTSGESTGYDESQIELWGMNKNGSAVLLNDSPNTAGNYIEAYDFIMENYNDVGLFYHGSAPGTVPNTPGNVSDAEAQQLVSQFTTIAVAFLVLFIIIGSFGLQRFFDFKDMFVPLMVVCLLAILAAGLFM